MIKRDYIEQMIQQLADMAERAFGLAKAQQHDEARREVDAGYETVGLSALIIDRLDAASVRAMAGDKVPVLLNLLETDAAVAELAGDAARARRRRALATALKAG